MAEHNISVALTEHDKWEVLRVTGAGLFKSKCHVTLASRCSALCALCGSAVDQERSEADGST